MRMEFAHEEAAKRLNEPSKVVTGGIFLFDGWAGQLLLGGTRNE